MTPTDTPTSRGSGTPTPKADAMVARHNAEKTPAGIVARELSNLARTLERELAAERERREAAHALLREWLDTELDAMDEEFDPWLESFTTRVNAALSPAGKAGGEEA